MKEKKMAKRNLRIFYLWDHMVKAHSNFVISVSKRRERTTFYVTFGKDEKRQRVDTVAHSKHTLSHIYVGLGEC